MRHHLILRVVVKLLVPPIMLFALYVQFHGDFSPGGGFQAGVIFAAGVILFALVYGLRKAKQIFPPWLVIRLAAVGVLLYAGTGVVSLFFGKAFLDYSALAANPKDGQHFGIIAVELGVGIAVATVMIVIFYAFASRPPRINDEDW